MSDSGLRAVIFHLKVSGLIPDLGVSKGKTLNPKLPQINSLVSDCVYDREMPA